MSVGRRLSHYMMPHQYNFDLFKREQKNEVNTYHQTVHSLLSSCLRNTACWFCIHVFESSMFAELIYKDLGSVFTFYKILMFEYLWLKNYYTSRLDLVYVLFGNSQKNAFFDAAGLRYVSVLEGVTYHILHVEVTCHIETLAVDTSKQANPVGGDRRVL